MKLKELLKILDADDIELYVNYKSVGYVRSGGVDRDDIQNPDYLESEVKKVLPWTDYNDYLTTDIYIELPFDEKEWIKEMMQEFLHRDSTHIFYSTYDNVTFIIDTRNPRHMGYAKCKSKDTFNVDKGFAIAWARYKGYEIPKEL